MDKDKKEKMLQLYSMYESAMYAIAYAILNNVEQAEDATHEAFLKLYTYFDDIEKTDSQKTKALVTRIVKNKAIDTYRKNKKIVMYEDNIKEKENDDTDPAIIVENQLMKLYRLNALENAMNDIPDNLRQIITMRYGYELKMTEIADISGENSATIRKQMERARKYLARRLNDISS